MFVWKLTSSFGVFSLKIHQAAHIRFVNFSTFPLYFSILKSKIHIFLRKKVFYFIHNFSLSLLLFFKQPRTVFQLSTSLLLQLLNKVWNLVFFSVLLWNQIRWDMLFWHLWMRREGTYNINMFWKGHWPVESSWDRCSHFI